MIDLDGLRSIFGRDMISASGSDAAALRSLKGYSHDQIGDRRYWQEPDAVVFPTSTQQVAELMKWANRTGTPITPRGGGSGLAGAAIPVAGGVVCSFAEMNRILEIDAANLMVTVEPGVVTNTLDEELKPHGLFFAGYPMSEDVCFIGGNVAENAGGGRAVKYGTTAHYVAGAEVVSPIGAVLSLGGKRLKDVTGFNLLQLVVGSEGTLGLFTKLIIRVVPRPGARGVLFAAFPGSDQATECITALKRNGPVSPSAIEYVDGATARSTNGSLPKNRRLDLPKGSEAYLLIEFDGPTVENVVAYLQQAADMVRSHQGVVQASGTERTGGGITERTDPTAGAEIAHGPGATGGPDAGCSTDAEANERAWRLRKQVPWWVKRTAGQWHSLEDIVVPPAAVSDLVAFVDTLRAHYEMPIAVFGHAGDGNFHVTPMKPEHMSESGWNDVVNRLLHDLYQEVVRLGGTISGEHGIGRKRVKDLPIALGEAELAAMKAIKQAWDPNNVLNPGVVFE